MGQEPKVRLKLNTWLLPPLLGLLLLVWLVNPYKGWMALLLGLGRAWLISYLWARSLARGLRLTREVRFGWVQVGDRLEEHFTLADSGLVPALGVEIVGASGWRRRVQFDEVAQGGRMHAAWRLRVGSHEPVDQRPIWAVYRQPALLCLNAVRCNASHPPPSSHRRGGRRPSRWAPTPTRIRANGERLECARIRAGRQPALDTLAHVRAP